MLPCQHFFLSASLNPTIFKDLSVFKFVDLQNKVVLTLIECKQSNQEKDDICIIIVINLQKYRINYADDFLDFDYNAFVSWYLQPSNQIDSKCKISKISF